MPGSIPLEAYGFVPDGSQTGEGVRPSDLLSLALLLSYIFIANFSGRFLLPTPKSQAQKTARWIFIWHIFDACIHIIHEGLFLYHCFFVYGPVLPDKVTSAALDGKGEPRLVGGHHWTNPGVYFLNQPDRVYGAHRGNSIVAHMWMDYAKADWRWAGTDLSIISTEALMLVFVGPLGIWIAYLIYQGKGEISKKAAFWIVVGAALETFGNWAVMLPEIVTGFPNLNLKDPATLWIHLVLMNSIWIGFPLMVMYRCYFILVAGNNSPPPPSKVTITTPLVVLRPTAKKNVA